MLVRLSQHRADLLSVVWVALISSHCGLWAVGSFRPNGPICFLGEQADPICTHEPYADGKIRCMKKTLNIDAALLAEARASCGAATDTETVRRGLEELVRQAALDRLIAYREPDAQDTPRRREPVLQPKTRRAAR